MFVFLVLFFSCFFSFSLFLFQKQKGSIVVRDFYFVELPSQPKDSEWVEAGAEEIPVRVPKNKSPLADDAEENSNKKIRAAKNKSPKENSEEENSHKKIRAKKEILPNVHPEKSSFKMFIEFEELLVLYSPSAKMIAQAHIPVHGMTKEKENRKERNKKQSNLNKENQKKKRK